MKQKILIVEDDPMIQSQLSTLLTGNGYQVYDEADLPRDSYDMVMEYLKDHGIEIAYALTFSMYLPKREEFHQRVKYEFPALAISLSDYNCLLSMFGLEPVELEDDTFTTQWDATSAEQERDEFLESHGSLETDGGILRLEADHYQYRFHVLKVMGVEARRRNRLAVLVVLLLCYFVSTWILLKRSVT